MTPDTDPNAGIPDAPLEGGDLIQQGWVAHVKGDLNAAEAAFRQALAEQAASVEGHYGLGMNLKIQGRPVEAAPEFKQVIELVAAGEMQADPPRAAMLRHLARYHLNTIASGQSEEPRP